MEPFWIALLVLLAYGLGIVCWSAFSLLYLIPEGSKRGFGRFMKDTDYIAEVMAPSQEMLICRIQDAFPMLRVFGAENGPEDFVEAVRLAVIDGTTQAVNTIIEANNVGGGAYVPAMAPQDQQAQGNQIFNALMQSLLPKL
ncbi:unnamed protein product, partial [marine sediment metagenome]